jgi:formamidopyrimidine-DNA glycosylase
MPELPEVEALRLGLKKVLVNATIRKISVSRAKIVSSSGTTRVDNPQKVQDFITIPLGQKIISLTRRAKNIMINLSGGGLFLVHLKMTGQLVFVALTGEQTTGGHPIQNQDLPNKHTYIIFELDNGTLYYNDVRQFGYVLYYPDSQTLLDTGHFDNLGIEPLSSDFTLEDFESRISQKTGVLKTVLLDQSVVVGCGNIYCDEVCFASGVLPMRKCNTLTKPEIKKLYDEIKRILPLAVEQGGSSVANYLLADGSRGNYAHYHLVYGKKGKPCAVCGRPLSSLKITGRTTVFCEHCQK